MKSSGLSELAYRLVAWLTAFSCLAELFLVVVSWIVSSVLPGSSVRSMLGSEGIRWFFGSFTENLLNPVLAWIILLGIGLGVFSRVGLTGAVRRSFSGIRLEFKERVGLVLAVFELLVSIIAMLLLCFMPHAILLSVTGDLFPSSFSRSAIAVVAFMLLLTGSTFGAVTGRIRNVVEWFGMMAGGISAVAPFVVAWLFVCQLAYSLCFVFSI